MDKHVAKGGVVAPFGVAVAELSRVLAVGAQPVKLYRARGELGGSQQGEHKDNVPGNNEGCF